MPTKDPKTCLHDNCSVSANVHRQMLSAGGLGAVMLSVGVSCQDCGTDFWFPGCGTGTSYTEPTTSTDGFTLVAPVVPANRRNAPDPSLVSVALRNGDSTKGYRQ